jgi:hypothetical protein
MGNEYGSDAASASQAPNRIYFWVSSTGVMKVAELILENTVTGFKGMLIFWNLSILYQF